MEEIKISQIKGYEDIKDYHIIRSDGKCINTKTGRTLKHKVSGKAKYPKYLLRTTDGHCKVVYIHRILAQAFIPNPNNLSVVRHLNDNENDWRLSNLAWGTISDNAHDVYNNTGKYNGKIKEVKHVRCIETGIIYRSTREAERQTGVNQVRIAKCCKGRYGCKTAGGYHWEYVIKED